MVVSFQQLQFLVRSSFSVDGEHCLLFFPQAWNRELEVEL